MSKVTVSAHLTEEDFGEQREQLMADLGYFSDGEQAARQKRPVGKPGKTRE